MSEENFPRLDELFRASEGKPVNVGGRTVRMAYEIPIEEGGSSGFIFVRNFKCEPVQGICLEVKGGELEVNGVRHSGIVLWMDSAPREVDFRVTGRGEAGLSVWNCWRGRFGEREAWLGSAGLVCETRGRGRYKFSCSDGPGVMEFNAVEFDVTLHEGAE
ncbi:hypothetical protein IQ279_27075 [Streptomyces verrucosisporus]|uniref:hypothetical protein n=1 Tax=Streptomyces verrucosisporus TaxID=1695161 RepID=UPI0019D0235E|nr:hypothetical protein [Streptomyces verrucosisporus]MBN3933221.1 hypothetical protein [Streptomyces verrucosisporus]